MHFILSILVILTSEYLEHERATHCIIVQLIMRILCIVPIRWSCFSWTLIDVQQQWRRCTECVIDWRVSSAWRTIARSNEIRKTRKRVAKEDMRRQNEVQKKRIWSAIGFGDVTNLGVQCIISWTGGSRSEIISECVADECRYISRTVTVNWTSDPKRGYRVIWELPFQLKLQITRCVS